MLISGLLVKTHPESLEQVKEELLKMEGIEIDSVLDDHKIVVVVASRDMSDEEKVSRQIKQIKGVVGINIAYHHFGDDERSCKSK